MKKKLFIAGSGLTAVVLAGALAFGVLGTQTSEVAAVKVVDVTEQNKQVTSADKPVEKVADKPVDNGPVNNQGVEDNKPVSVTSENNGSDSNGQVSEQTVTQNNVDAGSAPVVGSSVGGGVQGESQSQPQYQAQPQAQSQEQSYAQPAPQSYQSESSAQSQVQQHCSVQAKDGTMITGTTADDCISKVKAYEMTLSQPALKDCPALKPRHYWASNTWYVTGYKTSCHDQIAYGEDNGYWGQ